MRLRAPYIPLPAWADKLLMAALMIILSPVIAALFAMFAIMWLKRTLVGPRRHWSRWFAWHPVQVRKEGERYWPDREWRWLEMVERKSYDPLSDIYVRRAGGQWEPPTWSQFGFEEPKQ